MHKLATPKSLIKAPSLVRENGVVDTTGDLDPKSGFSVSNDLELYSSRTYNEKASTTAK
jgi:hypothetical protein